MATSAPVSPTTPGTYCFSAVYNPDTASMSEFTTAYDNTTANNADPNECFTVQPAYRSR